MGLKSVAVPLMGSECMILLGNMASRWPEGRAAMVQWWREVVGLDKVMAEVVLAEGGL